MNNSILAKALDKRFQYLLLGFFILSAVVFAFNFDLAAFQDLLERYEKTGLLIALLAYLLLGVTIIPSEPVTLLVLAWKGPLAAILLAAVGNTLAALVEFYIGVGLGDLTDFEQKKQRLPAFIRKLPIQSPAFLLLARMLPGFGPKFVSIAGGVYKVPKWTYLWTALVSNLFGAVFVTLGGSGILALIY